MKNTLPYFVLLGIIFAYTASEAQWTKVPCPFYPNTLAVHDGYIFAGSDQGVARSQDGLRWDTKNSGLHSQISPSPVLSFCSVGNTLLAGADFSEGLFASTDDGNHWIHVDSANAPEGVICFSEHNNFIFAASDNGTVTRSSDNGMTWVTVDSGFTQTPFGFNGIALSNFFNYEFFGNNAGQIYRTSNDGDSWDLVFQATTKSIFYTMTATGSSLFAQIGDSILRSLDSGLTWQVSQAQFGGNTLTSYNDIIFAGGYYGVLYSVDNGDSWKTSSAGFPDLTIIDAIVVKDGYIYASTNYAGTDTGGGVWRRPISVYTSEGVAKLSENDNPVTLSPNPTSGIVSISNIPSNTKHIIITNTLGEAVLEVANPQISNCQVDLSKLLAGIYYAKINAPNSVTMKKIVKE